MRPLFRHPTVPRIYRSNQKLMKIILFILTFLFDLSDVLLLSINKRDSNVIFSKH